MIRARQWVATATSGDMDSAAAVCSPTACPSNSVTNRLSAAASSSPAKLLRMFMVAFAIGMTLGSYSHLDLSRYLYGTNDSATNNSTATAALEMSVEPPVIEETTTLPDGVGMGACLLIKDDNHWVIEWLAYHWYVAPLRHLIVVIDPSSQTSPLEILDRWKDLMEIIIWEDKNFIKPIPKKTRDIYQNNTQLMMHRHRQASFINTCMRHFKRTKRIPWVFLTDTDEFLSLNYQHLLTNAASPRHRRMARFFTMDQPGSVLRFLTHDQKVSKRPKKCLYVKRYMVGSWESSHELVERYLPHGNSSNNFTLSKSDLNPYKFLTQRFLLQDTEKMTLGKNVVHLTAIRKQFVNELSDVHRVSREHCPLLSKGHATPESQFLKINHYLGTQEQWLFRQDPRASVNLHTGQVHNPGASKVLAANDLKRNLDMYQNLNKAATQFVYQADTQPWIAGFIERVGLEKAKELLAGVGELKSSTGTTTNSSTGTNSSSE
ncbi:expressed unknown protein [Seminavis robusta]|uniref:Uncharacterized protein n=1 Tax=Seminavis robusta TaxID=568900 RepID=A0A9N8ECI1_9STRA|nr:expressed unknown protein [Seminavis robusta]|eukprot:Sro946_g223300.1 n/a (490) ;mRNA; f:31057-32526